jgi:hypothetical protein
MSAFCVACYVTEAFSWATALPHGHGFTLCKPDGLAMKTLNDLLQVSLDCVLFTCVAGSRAYGTHTHESDEDIRGVYAVRADHYLDLETPPPQLSDERG